MAGELVVMPRFGNENSSLNRGLSNLGHKTGIIEVVDTFED